MKIQWTTIVFLRKCLCKCEFGTMEELILMKCWEREDDSRNNLEMVLVGMKFIVFF